MAVVITNFQTSILASFITFFERNLKILYLISYFTLTMLVMCHVTFLCWLSKFC